MPGIDNVCTVQPQYMALPAGMLDGNGDFGGAMAREMEEETGIRSSAPQMGRCLVGKIGKSRLMMYVHIVV